MWAPVNFSMQSSLGLRDSTNPESISYRKKMHLQASQVFDMPIPYQFRVLCLFPLFLATPGQLSRLHHPPDEYIVGSRPSIERSMVVSSRI